MTSAFSHSRRSIAAYAAPTAPESIAIVAFVVIPGYYASALGVPAESVGIALLVSRLLDAVLDPAVGVISDATYSERFGRKPMVLLGAVTMAISMYMLLVPPTTVTAIYLCLWSFAFYTCWTVFAVPYEAWGAELSSRQSERTSIFTWKAGFFYIGMAAFFIAPLLPGRVGTAMDASTLHMNALVIAALLPTLTYLALLLAPPGKIPLRTSSEPFVEVLKSSLTNKPLKLFLINALTCGIANGMNVGLAYVFIVDYLQLPDAFTFVLLGNVLSNLVALPLWRWTIQKIGKVRAWGLGLLLNAMTLPAFILAPVGAEGAIYVILLACASGASYSVCNVVLPAILGDIVDYQNLRVGSSPTGAYFSLYSLVRKLNSAFGSGLGFILIAALGYEAGVVPTGPAAFGIILGFALLPMLLQLIATALAFAFPLNDRRHAIVLRRLISRTNRNAALTPSLEGISR